MPKSIKTDNQFVPVITKQDLSNTIQNLKKFLKEVHYISDAPLLINNENEGFRLWAARILETKTINPIDLLEIFLNKQSPDIPQVPPFTVI